MALPQAHAAVWVLLAAALAYYGNGESDLLSLVLWDSRLNRLAVNSAFVSFTLNVLLFVYAYGWLEGVRKVPQPLHQVQWLGPAGGGTFAATLLCLVIGLWPVLGIATLPVIVVETYGAVMALHFAPTFGFLRVKKVHSD